MIFVTVGTQMHFDRLISAVDEWAGTDTSRTVVAQAGPSTYRPKFIKSVPFMSAQDFRDHMHQARVIVSHAGMGSIITALEFGKRIIVMPRRADQGEHRNDHQVATAKYFGSQGHVLVASDKEELFQKLSQFRSGDTVEPISSTASPALISTLRKFVESGSEPRSR